MSRAADLTPEQWTRLVERRRRSAADGRIQPVGRGERIPLSAGQERLWFLDHWSPGSAVYNVPIALRLRGPLDLPALRWALSRVVARHEVLRTVYPDERGVPYQRIEPAPTTISLPVDDLSSLPTSERLHEAQRLAAEAAITPFDLTTGPTFRVRLFRLDPTDHLLLVNTHHIATDLHSLSLLTQEVSALYQARRRRAPNPLPELTVQYADFSVWQRRQLREGALRLQLDAWRQRLQGVPPLDLPTDRSRPTHPTSRGDNVSTVLSPRQHQRLQDIARQERTSLLAVLLAAFGVVLAKHSGSDDMAIGTILSGRTRAESAPLIGFFANTAVLRVSLAHATSLREVIARAHEAVAAAHAGQDVPFATIVEALGLARDTSRHPIFQVALTLQPTLTQNAALDEVTVEPAAIFTGRARFDLSVSASAMPDGGLGLGAEYATDLFDRDRIERLMQHLAITLRALPDNLTTDPARLDIMPAEEHQTMAAHSQGPTAAQPFLLLDRIERTRKNTPNAPAVIAADATLTYTELDQQVNRLAWALRQRGVRTGTPVGVCHTRTSRLVVALLAVLRAGGAYVPLDPRYPAARLDLVMRDSGTQLVICDEASATALPDSVPLLCLDASAEEVAAQPATAPPGRIEPAQVAYMLHTSGSTGRPKGVMVEHAQVANLLDWADQAFEPGTTLASTSICFDLSVFELFAPLSNGGATVLVPDLTALATSPPPAPVTLINTVPSVLAALLRDHALPPGVRTVTLAGEPLPPELARKVQELGVADVRNLYGPTETTTFSTATGPLQLGDGAMSIGRPINGTRCHVLDDSLRPMPLGVPGELYLGGAGVTRGYAGRPGLTAERYVPDPFAGDGSRLYRTGDLARLRADGELELLGRNDAQLKVNGFRIEPGEIEAELARHPAVLQVAVGAVTDARDVKVLAAYVVTRPGERPPDAADLRAFASARLPRHLLPHRVVPVAALPTTVSGKIDRAGLAALEDAAPLLPRGALGGPMARLPRGAVGGPMARLWAEVLGVPEVGDDDDYFDLGGTSLLSLRLLAAVHETFGADLPPRTLFECPTPALLASAVATSEIYSSEIKESVAP